MAILEGTLTEKGKGWMGRTNKVGLNRMGKRLLWMDGIDDGTGEDISNSSVNRIKAGGTVGMGGRV